MLLIYYKRKEGIPLTEEEQRIWEEFIKQVGGELPFDEENLATRARFQQQMLPWEQYCEKNNIVFPAQKLQAFGRVNRSKPVRPYMVMAASLMLIMMVGWWFIPHNQHSEDQSPSTCKRLVTARGAVDRLELNDGTIVWLNAATELCYPANFGSGERVVVLEKGEALFDVAHRSAGQPFIVLHKDQKIEVLGTRFNIKAYAEEGGVFTITLLEGSLSVTHGSRSLLLKPGQQVRLYKQGQFSACKGSLKEVTAWKDNFFTFIDKPLSEIMTELGRWYDMEVIYLDPVKEVRFVIHEFPRNEPLTQLLGHLEVSGLVHFEVKDKKIYISR